MVWKGRKREEGKEKKGKEKEKEKNCWMWNGKKKDKLESVTMSNHCGRHRVVAVALLPPSKSCPNFSTNSNSNQVEKGILGNIIPAKPSWRNTEQGHHRYVVIAQNSCGQFVAWERPWSGVRRSGNSGHDSISKNVFLGNWLNLSAPQVPKETHHS